MIQPRLGPTNCRPDVDLKRLTLKPRLYAQFEPWCKFTPGCKIAPGSKFAPPYVAFICQ